MQTSGKIAVALGAITLLGVGYAIYFDHKRRNDPKFRRKLKRQRKRQETDRKVQQTSATDHTANIIASALARCDDEVAPTSMEGREKYFMDQISMGEALLPKGPAAYEDAAVHFYRAFRTYPSPMELLMILQKTMPADLFQIIMGMMQLDMVKKQEKYYELFPPKEMNVRLTKLSEAPQPDGTKIVKRALNATRSFSKGAVIFTEAPVVAALHPTLEGGPFCTHCLKLIPANEPSRFCTNCGDKARFCSDACFKAAEDQYHSQVCVGSYSQPNVSGRALVDSAKETGNLLPTMAARFLVKTVQEEQRRVASGQAEEEYGIWEHLERLKYLELRPDIQDAKELQLVLTLLETKVPGVAEFFNDERYLTLKGRMLYNSYAITANLANVDVTAPLFKEGARTDGDQPRIGTGLYKFAAHLTHSCEPNCAVRFQSDSDGNTLSLVALQPIAAGDQLNISYVPAGEDNHYSERQKVLAARWRFQCPCDRCEREQKEQPPYDAEPLLEEKTEEELAAEMGTQTSAAAFAYDMSTMESGVSRIEEIIDDEEEEAEELVAESRRSSLNPDAPSFTPGQSIQLTETEILEKVNEVEAESETVAEAEVEAEAEPEIEAEVEAEAEIEPETEAEPETSERAESHMFYSTSSRTMEGEPTVTTNADGSTTIKTTTIHEHAVEHVVELTEEEAAAALAAGELIEEYHEGEVITPTMQGAQQISSEESTELLSSVSSVATETIRASEASLAELEDSSEWTPTAQ